MIEKVNESITIYINPDSSHLCFYHKNQEYVVRQWFF